MYIKFTEGECPYFTPNKPYKVHIDSGHGMVTVLDDQNQSRAIYMPECSHILGVWRYCDENGNRITPKGRDMTYD